MPTHVPWAPGCESRAQTSGLRRRSSESSLSVVSPRPRATRHDARPALSVSLQSARPAAAIPWCWLPQTLRVVRGQGQGPLPLALRLSAERQKPSHTLLQRPRPPAHLTPE